MFNISLCVDLIELKETLFDSIRLHRDFSLSNIEVENDDDLLFIEIYTEEEKEEEGFQKWNVTIPCEPNPYDPNGIHSWGANYFTNAGFLNTSEILQSISNSTGVTYRVYFDRNDFDEYVPETK